MSTERKTGDDAQKSARERKQPQTESEELSAEELDDVAGGAVFAKYDGIDGESLRTDIGTISPLGTKNLLADKTSPLIQNKLLPKVE